MKTQVRCAGGKDDAGGRLMARLLSLAPSLTFFFFPNHQPQSPMDTALYYSWPSIGVMHFVRGVGFHRAHVTMAPKLCMCAVGRCGIEGAVLQLKPKLSCWAFFTFYSANRCRHEQDNIGLYIRLTIPETFQMARGNILHQRDLRVEDAVQEAKKQSTELVAHVGFCHVSWPVNK